MKNLDADVRGGGGGFGNSDTPGQGEGGGLKIRDFVGRTLCASCFLILLIEGQ